MIAQTRDSFSSFPLSLSLASGITRPEFIGQARENEIKDWVCCPVSARAKTVDEPCKDFCGGILTAATQELTWLIAK